MRIGHIFTSNVQSWPRVDCPGRDVLGKPPYSTPDWRECQLKNVPWDRRNDLVLVTYKVREHSNDFSMMTKKDLKYIYVSRDDFAKYFIVSSHANMLMQYGEDATNIILQLHVPDSL